VRDLVFDDTVADIYLGPTLTARLRTRFEGEHGSARPAQFTPVETTESPPESAG
jgi:hypothetical protein